VNTVPQFSTPNTGALRFSDIDNESVSVAHDAALSAANWTVEAWVTTTNADADFNRVVSKPVAGDQTYSIVVINGEAQIRSSVGVVTSTGVTVADGVPHHIAGVYDSVAETLTLYVDGDACPVVIRDIIFKAAKRTQTRVTFVANHYVSLPRSPFIAFKQVPKGFDIADNYIAEAVESGDLVITSDIPLAADVIAKGATALSSRGELFTEDNIKPRLNMRDFMDTMRASGVEGGGPPPLSQQDRQAFANHLDRWLAKR